MGVAGQRWVWLVKDGCGSVCLISGTCLVTFNRSREGITITIRPLDLPHRGFMGHCYSHAHNENSPASEIREDILAVDSSLVISGLIVTAFWTVICPCR
jgi:hypothetical protein